MKKIFTKNLAIQILIFFTLLGITGCEKIEIGEPNYFKTGIKYRIDNSLSFAIKSINDYRCPKDLECFWSGDVELNFKINYNLSNTDTLIYLWTHNNNPFIIDGYKWEITEVNPWPNSGETVDRSDYRIKVLITEN